MARGEIKIPIAVDTSGISKEIDNGLVEPLEDAEDALKALSKVDAGKDLERDLERAGKATDELKDELDDTRDQLKKLGYAAKDAGDDAKRGMSRAEEGVEEFGDEAQSTAKEAAASFDGSAESIVDAFQEVAANAFAGFGPAGVLAGLAIAAGIGMATQAFQQAEEAAEELRQKANEYANDAIDAGVSTEKWLSASEQVVERIRELQDTRDNGPRLWFMEDPDNLEKWVDSLEKVGREADEVEEVLSSSTDGMKDYRDAIEEAYDATKREAGALIERNKIDPVDGYRDKVKAIREQQDGYKELLGLLDDEIQVREKSAAAEKTQAEAGIEAALERAEAEQEAASIVEAANQQIEDSYDSLRDAAAQTATSQDGVFNIDQWIADVAAGKELLATHAANVAAMSEELSATQLDNFNSLPAEIQQQVAAAWASGDATLRSSIVSTLTDSAAEGVSGTNAELDGIESEVDVDVKVKAEVKAAENEIESVSKKKRTAEIAVKTTGKAEAKGDLDALARTRNATINVRADTSDFNASVNSARRSQENRPVYITVKYRSGGNQIV